MMDPPNSPPALAQPSAMDAVPPSVLLLTKENLGCHDGTNENPLKRERTDTSPSRPSNASKKSPVKRMRPERSPSRSSKSSTGSGGLPNCDTLDTTDPAGLEMDHGCHSIFMDLSIHGQRCTMPSDLEQHIHDMRTLPSPDLAAGQEYCLAIQKYFHHSRADQKLNLGPLLLDTTGIPTLVLSYDRKIDTTFSPKSAFPHLGFNNTAPNHIDLVVGYAPQLPNERSDLMNTSKATFLSEDSLEKKFNPLRRVLLPTITCQWVDCKRTCGTQWVAEVRSARVGAIMVNLMHGFLESLGLIEPTAFDTHHWSLTTDAQTIFLHIHWRFATAKDYGVGMKTVARAFVDDVKQVGQLIAIIHRILEYASKERLELIRAALIMNKKRLEANKGGA